MQNRFIPILIGLVLIVGIGVFVYTTKKSSILPYVPKQTVSTKQSIQTTNQTEPTTSGINLSQISTHNSRSSCWTTINSGVYDLTSWIPNHPGGEQAVLSICGKDGTAKFNKQHEGSSKVVFVLSGFKIGTLTQ